MARHPSARKVRRQQTDPDDAFLARILEISAWSKRNARVLTIVGVILVVGVSAGLYYRNYQAAIREHAAVEFVGIQQTVASGNRALAIRDLEGFVRQFGATPSGTDARVILGQLYLEDGRPDAAAAMVEELARRPQDPLGATAAFLLGAAYEASGELDRAEATYLRIADRAYFDFQKREALDDAARLRMDRDDHAGAVALYERLVDITPEDRPERGIFLMRLGEARAKAMGQPAGG